jgi:hypothetical protein
MRSEEGTEKTQETLSAHEKPSQHPAFGMWKDRADTKDPVAYVRKMKEPRYTWDEA